MGTVAIVILLAGLQALPLVWAKLLPAGDAANTSQHRTAMITGFVATLMFGVVAGIVLYIPAYLRFESAFAERLHDHGPAIIGLLEKVANRDRVLYFGLGLAGVVLLFVRARWDGLVLWVGTLGGGLAFLELLKWALDRPRPAGVDALQLQGLWEFPSGHAFGSVVFAGLIYFLSSGQMAQGWQRALGVLLVAAALMVGFVRLLVGTHYLGDVVGGYAIGVAWVALGMNAHAVFQQHVRGYTAAKRGSGWSG